MEKILRYSWNPKVTSDLSKEEGGKKPYGWLFTETNWNEKELTEMIRTRSYIPSELKDGHKILTKVVAVHSVVLDFDKNEPTLLQFLEEAKRWRFSWIAHTTKNHQIEKIDPETQQNIKGSAVDKFRVIIPLTTTISNSEYELSVEFWLKKFPKLDTSSFQGNRYFLVNPKAEVYFHDFKDGEGNTVFFDPYESKMISPKQQKKKNKKSLGDFEKGDVLLKYDETKIIYADITEKTIVICPYCNPADRQDPSKHNAFVDFNDAGQMYLYCSSEDKTYWINPKEIDPSRSKLFFNEDVGFVARLTEDKNGFKVFKNNDDWLSFCNANNINYESKTFLPRRSIIFDPSKPSGLQEEYFNLFEQSIFLQNSRRSSNKLSDEQTISLLKQRTQVIYEILLNVFGDEKYVLSFINWNAAIINEREKVDTCWLITSHEQGIGKGLMFDRILKPIYGDRQAVMVNSARMAKNFNSQDLNCWLKCYDEVFKAGDTVENLARREWLKFIITSKEQTIELKGYDAFQVKNHMNLILFSNSDHPLFLENQDRRFCVIHNEDAKKVEALSFYDGLDNMRKKISAELQHFTDIILSYNYNKELANKAIVSVAKQNLQSLSSDPYAEFAKALNDRDVDYFLLAEIFPLTSEERAYKKSMTKSAEEDEAETAIKEGYIPARYMSRISKFHFQKTHYKKILERLKMNGVINKTHRVNDWTTISAYKIK
jgi:hypothetical protein